MGITSAELRAMGMGHLLPKDAPPATAPAPKQPRHVTGMMNKTEARFAFRLKLMQLAGEVDAFYFEAVKLRLADRTWYTPDFLVVISGRMIICEVKGGFIRPDSVTKFKIAAEMFPQFGWEMWQYNKGAWNRIRQETP